MKTGALERVRMAATGDFNDALRSELEPRGIPPSNLAGIIVLMTADLTSPTRDAFEITPENPTEPSPSQPRVWRVEPRTPGEHVLDLKLTLSARFPSDGEVETKPVVFTRSIAIEASPFYPLRHFLNVHWPGVIASFIALLLAAGIAWTLWRGHSAFGHR